MSHTLRTLALGLTLLSALTTCAGQVKQAHSPLSIPAIKLSRPSPFAGSYLARTGLGSRMTIHLRPDGNVRFIHDYLNKDPIAETGVWKESRDKTATITLTGLDDGRRYNKPDVITFKLVGDHLVTVKYDYDIHGYRGLRLKRITRPRPYRAVTQ